MLSYIIFVSYHHIPSCNFNIKESFKFLTFFYRFINLKIVDLGLEENKEIIINDGRRIKRDCTQFSCVRVLNEKRRTAIV